MKRTILESLYRQYVCEVIIRMGVQLKLQQITVATATVYFHRFSTAPHSVSLSADGLSEQSLQQNIFAAAASLFLATKVEENFRRLKDIVQVSFKVSHEMRNSNKVIFPLEVTSVEYERRREEVLKYERMLLKVLAFDFVVVHPYTYLMEFLRKINGSQELSKAGWDFVNDSLKTPLCLYYSPSLIACTALYLGSNRAPLTPLAISPSGIGFISLPWQDLCHEATLENLEELSQEILKLKPIEVVVQLVHRKKLVIKRRGVSPQRVATEAFSSRFSSTNPPSPTYNPLLNFEIQQPQQLPPYPNLPFHNPNFEMQQPQQSNLPSFSFPHPVPPQSHPHLPSTIPFQPSQPYPHYPHYPHPIPPQSHPQLPSTIPSQPSLPSHPQHTDFPKHPPHLQTPSVLYQAQLQPLLQFQVIYPQPPHPLNHPHPPQQQQIFLQIQPQIQPQIYIFQF